MEEICFKMEWKKELLSQMQRSGRRLRRNRRIPHRLMEIERGFSPDSSTAFAPERNKSIRGRGRGLKFETLSEWGFELHSKPHRNETPRCYRRTGMQVDCLLQQAWQLLNVFQNKYRNERDANSILIQIS